MKLGNYSSEELIRVQHISYRRNLIVPISEITVTHPVPGVDAYWYGETRIVLTDQQKQLVKGRKDNHAEQEQVNPASQQKS